MVASCNLATRKLHGSTLNGSTPGTPSAVLEQVIYTHIVVHAFAIYTRKTKTAREGCKTVSRYIDIIPNTAVFGPTIFIGTITARTTRMKILDEDFG